MPFPTFPARSIYFPLNFWFYTLRVMWAGFTKALRMQKLYNNLLLWLKHIINNTVPLQQVSRNQKLQLAIVSSPSIIIMNNSISSSLLSVVLCVMTIPHALLIQKAIVDVDWWLTHRFPSLLHEAFDSFLLHTHCPLPLARMDQFLLIIDHGCTKQSISGISQAWQNVAIFIQLVIDMPNSDMYIWMVP